MKMKFIGTDSRVGDLMVRHGYIYDIEQVEPSRMQKQRGWNIMVNINGRPCAYGSYEKFWENWEYAACESEIDCIVVDKADNGGSFSFYEDVIVKTWNNVMPPFLNPRN